MAMQNAFDEILAPYSRTSGILLAVSGGIDSMCMADLFSNSELELPFAIAHCNFHLRGEDSDGDERLVTDWARERGVVFHRKDFDTLSYAEEHSVSTEMAARELRYGWFAELCGKYGYSAVAVAHNSNDNAETLILNLLRGSGIKGLKGMGLESALPAGDGGCLLLRPMLGFTRKNIEGYVRAGNVPYREDRTNSETVYKRNKIRNLVFPVFEQINPSFVKTFSREMSYFSSVEGILSEYYEKYAPACVRKCPHAECAIDVAELKKVPSWPYLLYMILEKYGFNSSTVKSLETLVSSGGGTFSGKRFNAEKYFAVTASSEIIVSACRPVPGRTLPQRDFPRTGASDAVVVVRTEGRYFFNGRHFSVKVVRITPETVLKLPAGMIMFDRKALDFPFVCRRWMHGDWFVPIGMKGRKKVSDYFTDLKYSVLDKERAILIAGSDGQHIKAVLGERIDDSVKVRPETEEAVAIIVE